MPVIRSRFAPPGLRDQGFLPCSQRFRQTLARALQLQQYDFAKDLFQQAHLWVWQFDDATQEYIHRWNPRMRLSAAQYDHWASANWDGRDLTERDIATLCPAFLQPHVGADPRAKANTAVFSLASRFFGPQQPVVARGKQRMQGLQQQVYVDAEAAGWKVLQTKTLGTYAPSPFLQQFDAASNRWQPLNPQRHAGQSGGPCRAPRPVPGSAGDAKDQKQLSACDAGLECHAGAQVCVVPENKRQCPPFQWPRQPERPGWPLALTAERTRPLSTYSTFHQQQYVTCAAPAQQGSDRWASWLPEVRLQTGLPLDVEFQAPEVWALHRSPVYRDPGSGAAFKVANVASVAGPTRIYMSNAAFTPQLQVAALRPLGGAGGAVGAVGALGPARPNRRRRRSRDDDGTAAAAAANDDADEDNDGNDGDGDRVRKRIRRAVPAATQPQPQPGGDAELGFRGLEYDDTE